MERMVKAHEDNYHYELPQTVRDGLHGSTEEVVVDFMRAQTEFLELKKKGLVQGSSVEDHAEKLWRNMLRRAGKRSTEGVGGGGAPRFASRAAVRRARLLLMLLMSLKVRARALTPPWRWN